MHLDGSLWWSGIDFERKFCLQALMDGRRCEGGLAFSVAVPRRLSIIPVGERLLCAKGARAGANSQLRTLETG